MVKNTDLLDRWVRDNGMPNEGNTEGFADDLTLLFLMTREAIKEIKRTLNSFYLISGLSLNVSKTQLMVAGSNEYIVGSKIEDIEIVSSVKILGVRIDRTLEQLGENWEEKIRKMERLSNFWSLQKLSITGRIMVAKTFLYL